jgi:branched-chain amino acid transport system ATP-binding protein
MADEPLLKVQGVQTFYGNIRALDGLTCMSTVARS